MTSVLIKGFPKDTNQREVDSISTAFSQNEGTCVLSSVELLDKSLGIVFEFNNIEDSDKVVKKYNQTEFLNYLITAEYYQLLDYNIPTPPNFRTTLDANKRKQMKDLRNVTEGKKGKKKRLKYKIPLEDFHSQRTIGVTPEFEVNDKRIVEYSQDANSDYRSKHQYSNYGHASYSHLETHRHSPSYSPTPTYLNDSVYPKPLRSHHDSYGSGRASPRSYRSETHSAEKLPRTSCRQSYSEDRHSDSSFESLKSPIYDSYYKKISPGSFSIQESRVAQDDLRGLTHYVSTGTEEINYQIAKHNDKLLSRRHIDRGLFSGDYIVNSNLCRSRSNTPVIDENLANPYRVTHTIVGPATPVQDAISPKNNVEITTSSISHTSSKSMSDYSKKTTKLKDIAVTSLATEVMTSKAVATDANKTSAKLNDHPKKSKHDIKRITSVSSIDYGPSKYQPIYASKIEEIKKEIKKERLSRSKVKKKQNSPFMVVSKSLSNQLISPSMENTTVTIPVTGATLTVTTDTCSRNILPNSTKVLSGCTKVSTGSPKVTTNVVSTSVTNISMIDTKDSASSPKILPSPKVSPCPKVLTNMTKVPLTGTHPTPNWLEVSPSPMVSTVSTNALFAGAEASTSKTKVSINITPATANMSHGCNTISSVSTVVSTKVSPVTAKVSYSSNNVSSVSEVVSATVSPATATELTNGKINHGAINSDFNIVEKVPSGAMISGCQNTINVQDNQSIRKEELKQLLSTDHFVACGHNIIRTQELKQLLSYNKDTVKVNTSKTAELPKQLSKKKQNQQQREESRSEAIYTAIKECVIHLYATHPDYDEWLPFNAIKDTLLERNPLATDDMINSAFQEMLPDVVFDDRVSMPIIRHIVYRGIQPSKRKLSPPEYTILPTEVPIKRVCEHSAALTDVTDSNRVMNKSEENVSWQINFNKSLDSSQLERFKEFAIDCMNISTTVKLLICKNPDLEARLVSSCKEILGELQDGFSKTYQNKTP